MKQLRIIFPSMIILFAGLSWYAVRNLSGFPPEGSPAPRKHDPDLPGSEAKESERRWKRIEDLLVNAEKPADLLACKEALKPGEKLCSHGEAFARAYKKWYQGDLGKALSLIEALPDEESREIALMNGKHWFLEDPDAFLSTAHRCLPSVLERPVIGDIFGVLGTREPEKGMALIEAMGQGERKEKALRVLFGTWIEHDPDKALAAVKSLEFPEDRKTAYRTIVVSSVCGVRDVYHRDPDPRKVEAARKIAAEIRTRKEGREAVAELLEDIRDPIFKEVLGAQAAPGTFRRENSGGQD